MWTMWKLIRSLWKHYDEIPDWSETDASALNAFLKSAAGLKLKNALVSHVLNSSQSVVSNGGNEFECGAITGMKTLWIFIETMTTAAVAPEADQDSYE